MKNRDVAEAYARQMYITGDSPIGPHTKKMFIEGVTIFSYGRHFPIAKRITPRLYLFTTDGYSVTTGKHKHHVQRALREKGAMVLETPMMTAGGSPMTDAEMFAAAVEETARKLESARHVRTRTWKIEDALRQYRALREYAATLDVEMAEAAKMAEAVEGLEALEMRLKLQEAAKEGER